MEEGATAEEGGWPLAGGEGEGADAPRQPPEMGVALPTP